MRTCIVVLIIAMTLLMVGCSEQVRAKNFGGTVTHIVEGKVVLVTWKGGADLWILTRPKIPGETPILYTFQEFSSLGVFQGKIYIQEK